MSGSDATHSSRSGSSSDEHSDQSDGDSGEGSHSARALAAALRSADKQSLRGALPSRLRREFFPRRTKTSAFITLYSRLFEDGRAWAELEAFPPTVTMTDLGNGTQGQTKNVAMMGARYLQHAAFRLAVLQCGLHNLLVHLLAEHPKVVNEPSLSGRLRDITNWTAAAYQEQVHFLRKHTAAMRSGRVEAWQLQAPLMAPSTPATSVLDDKTLKYASEMEKAAKRASSGGGGGGGGDYRPAKKPQGFRRPHPHQGFSGRGGYRNQSAAPGPADQ